jgi:hypothetical protein
MCIRITYELIVRILQRFLRMFISLKSNLIQNDATNVKVRPCTEMMRQREREIQLSKRAVKFPLIH